MLRYIHRLQSRDLSLTHVDDPARLVHDEAQRHQRDAAGDAGRSSARIHPFAPAEQTQRLSRDCSTQLEAWLAEITGFAAVSLQPNAGSQGEYAGLLVIRALSRSRAARRTATSA